jgi:mRNA degradation ribonuclease J1/J2
VSEDLVEERRAMSGEGFVFIRVVVDGRKGRLVGEPVVESRGWVEPAERQDWHDQVASAVADSVRSAVDDGQRDPKELARQVRRATGRLVSRRTGRRPALVPTVEVR